ncbi:MAG: reductive dehalogenase [Phycisphaerales bacterium]|jgi:reductive dehalogenase|nr:reductive dehalogenase [Phycisphaerales bacterium]
MKPKVNRRNFLKAVGAGSAVTASAGLWFFGTQAGQDPASYTGMTNREGGFQTFNRRKWSVSKPTYEKVGETSRPDARTEVIFARMGQIRGYDKAKGLGEFPQHVQDYYKAHPEDLELDTTVRQEIHAKRSEEIKKPHDEFILSKAWSSAMGAVGPRGVNAPPEKWDFPRGSNTPYKMKDPKRTSRLIKKISHQFGSTLVGIAKLNPDWVYKYPMNGGRGFKANEPMEVPEHWQYAIVVGVPMSWDPMYANPPYGTSNDAYSLSRIVAHRLTAFIKNLGYAARPHTPGADYDLMVPPIMVDAGLGEQGRHSIVITPELGCNFRPSIVTTNIPMAPDKPIDIGVQDFCKTCKVCAKQCPSGAISHGEKVEIRGYKRYALHSSKCSNFWSSKLGNMGCRLCVAVCPYTRKSNWLHQAALNVSLHDPTGLSDIALAKMQEVFYPGQEPQKYYMPSMGGENASYRPVPWWLKTDDFIDTADGE